MLIVDIGCLRGRWHLWCVLSIRREHTGWGWRVTEALASSLVHPWRSALVHVAWLPKHLALCNLCVAHSVPMLVLEIDIHDIAFLVGWLLVLLLLKEIMLPNSKILVITILVHVVGHALGHVPLSSLWLLAGHVGAWRDTAITLGLQLLTSAQRKAMLHQRWRHRPLLKVTPAALSLFTRSLLRSLVHHPSTPQISSHRTSRSHSLTHLWGCIHRNRLSTPYRPHAVPTSTLVPLWLTPRTRLPKVRLHLPLQRRLAPLFLLWIVATPLHCHLGSSILDEWIIVLILVHGCLVFIVLLLLLILIIFSLFEHSLFIHLSLFILSLYHVIVV